MISYFNRFWAKRFVLEQDKLWLGNELLGRVVFKARGRQNANCKCYFVPEDYTRAYTKQQLIQILSQLHDLIPVESIVNANVLESKVYSVMKAGDNYRCDKLLCKIHSQLHDLLPVESNEKARVSEAKVYSVLKADDNYKCDKLLGKIVENKFVAVCTLEIHELASVIAADWNENASGLLDQNQVDWFEGVE